MTFYPLTFWGIPPYLGWQGIIPSKAKKMAETSVDLITNNLLRVEERFDQLDSEEINRHIEHSLQLSSKKILNEVGTARFPLLWKRLPPSLKTELEQNIYHELPQVLSNIIADFKKHINQVFDIKNMVVSALVSDKNLLNEIFLQCGEKEFKFIEKSGFYFGFLLGIVQMFIWLVYPQWWTLPLAGILVGYVTNWLALKLIFSPVKPIYIGKIRFQGLFIQRQQEVAEAYAALVAQKIFTPDKIFEAIVYGPTADNFAAVIDKHVKDLVDKISDEGEMMALVKLFSNERNFEAMRNIAAYSFKEDLPIILLDVYDYTAKSLDIQNTLHQKMAALSAPEFVGFLHPVFQEDETKLILVGAFLGGLAGWIQYLLM